MTSFCSLVLYFCFNFMLLFSFYCFFCFFFFFFFKQKTAYEMRISDWSSDVCSSDLLLSGLIVTLPLAPWVTAATVSAPPPGLLSLPRTSMTSALSRSEEHTSELQSLMRISYAVFCLKKKKALTKTHYTPPHTANYTHTI